MDASTAIARPQRWDRPFGEGGMADPDIDRVLDSRLFHDIDPTQFSEQQPLREIIRNDARLVSVKAGDVLVREGDYGNSMFVILSGCVRVTLDHTRDDELGRGVRRQRRGLFQSLKQLWTNTWQPEVRDIRTYQAGSINVRGEADGARTYLDDLDDFLRRHETLPLTEGHAFGEIAALARTQRTATVVADCDTELVELRWQGLRDIRKRDRGFREYIDGLYRERSLVAHLRESPLLAHLPDDILFEIAAETSFETHGSFEWFRTFKKVKGDASVLQDEPVIADQGHYVDGLILVRSGFARITERLDHGHRTVGYATTNDHFGLEELTSHWRSGRELSLQRSLRAVGYVDILRVPTHLVERHILPNAPEELLPDTTPSQRDPDEPAWREQCADLGLAQSLVDFLVDHRTVNGTATMLIDTDRCTGCDDCVQACASTHGGNPRFKRHGPIHENIQVTNACMHCADPVCLIGCPTGAIHRHERGPVVIDDATCIGCGTCANACPYDNISMVEIRDQNGAFVVDEGSQEPIVKATKCDLCFDQLGGPACQRACPHDALIRVDMRDHKTLAQWVNRS
jgi:Fe-S-cluster-containing dehydrogenase component/CRP-like cAMP-binding protein